MRLSISNIAWDAVYDNEMYRYIQNAGFNGIEIAPTRIFPESPYDKIDEALIWSLELKKDYFLDISSMQSIWYGHSEKIFGTKEERQSLIDYTKKAIIFAETIGCRNLVFGNPKNRDTDNIKESMPVAIDFFKEIGDFAAYHNTCIALEPNPTLYNTRFMNRTEEAVKVIELVNSPGIKLNVDLGTILYNKENIDYLSEIKDFINHIHISEPGLKKIEKRYGLHKSLMNIAKNIDNVYISIEMGKQEMNDVKEVIDYIRNIGNEVE